VVLTSPECPRWHAGRLWFSDIRARRVLAVDLAGQVEVVADFTDYPVGLGWREAEKLLVVGTTERSVFQVTDSAWGLVADLRAYAAGDCNDMVIDGWGRGWIGDLGYGFFAGEERKPGRILHMQADGATRVAAEGLDFPNGMVVSQDGGTLIVAETFGQRLTTFKIGADGVLFDRRVFAECAGAYPDGICLDAEGAVWVADPGSNRVLRILDGGHIEQTLTVSEGRRVFACMLGGEDRRTLFLCTDTPHAAREPESGWIEMAHVSAPGLGWP
jgi:adhesin HecA-like repeat protein